ncbi:MAG TPA: ATP-binding protein [Ktedonobacterales bacterium]|nr:ATP-binding protein [Ktedonobacterales bacterium]
MTYSRILIVDDDTALLRALPKAIQLRMSHIQTDTCESAPAALERIAEVDYDAIVSDIKMPGMDGLALLERIHALRPDTPTLLITGHGEDELAIRALRGGAYDFIQKPIHRDYFIASLTRAIQVRALKRQVEEQRHTLERHALELEEVVAERTRRLREASAAKDELLHAHNQALASARAANEGLRALQTVTDAALAHLALDELLPELLGRIKEVLGADTVAILLISEDGKELLVRAAIGIEEEIAGMPRIPLGKGFAGKIAATREPMVIKDVATTTVRSILAERSRSLVGVPLLVAGLMTGVLQCGSYETRHFTQNDVRLLQLVADRIALAIDHARLYAEARQALREQREARAQVERLAHKLGQQAAELDTIIEAMPDGLYVYDANTKLVRMNERGASLAGLTLEQMQKSGEPLPLRNSRYHLDGSPLTLEEYPVSQALRGITVVNARFISKRSETDEMIAIQNSAAPIRDGNGQITGAVVVSRDITALYQLEQQKDEFLSIASHELKTPLTSLKGLTQITRRRLERAGSPEAAHLAGMERAIGRMELLVNDLLDISRIESGKLALRTERADLVEICRQVAEEQRAATERTILLELPEAPIELEVDVDRIGQVLSNLLSNALKYSPQDEAVVLSARLNEGEALFSVVDKGPGIPADDLPFIFERFYRVPGITVQAGSGVGLGLGLYICNDIVEHHGGRITVESAPNHGSVFTVALPLAPARKVACHPVESRNGAER